MPKFSIKSVEVSFLAAIAVVGMAVLAVWGIPYYLGLYGDDACYLLQTFRFRTGGLCLICGKELQPMPYAAGWSIFLLPFVDLFGDRVGLYRLLSGTLTICAVLLVADIARRSWGRIVAFLLALMLFTSDGVLGHATTLMSEPLYLFLIASLVWLDQTRDSLSAEVAKGLLAGCCFVTRGEGAVIAVALLAVTLQRRRWKAAALQLAVGGSFVVFLQKSWPVELSHEGQSRELFELMGINSSYLWAWLMNHLLLLGRVLWAAPAWLNRTVGFLLVILAIVAILRNRPRQLDLKHWILLGTLGALFFWPYLSIRYWVAVLPLWLLAGLKGLPRQLQIGLLSALLLAQVGSQLSQPRALSEQAVASKMDFLEALGKLNGTGDGKIASVYPAREHFWSHRTWAPFIGAESLSPMARNLYATGAEMITWDRQSNLITNAAGGTQFVVPDYLDLWLERSTLFEVLYSNESGLVARVVVNEEKLGKAFELWQEAINAASPQQQLLLLKQALEEVPDLPEVRAFWLITATQVPGSSRDEIVKMATSYVEQYPHDFPVNALLVTSLAELGAVEQAASLAELSRKEAERLGNVAAVQMFARL